jgi:hypothetical protein
MTTALSSSRRRALTSRANYSGIGYIPFAKDNLDAKVNELLRELFAMKIIRVSVGDD